MDDKSLEMLELPKVREILSGFTSFPASRQLALELKPSSDAALITLLLKQSAEARHLLSVEPQFSVGDVVDVRGVAEMAARGKVLELKALLEVQSTLAAARYGRSTLKKLAGEVPSLWAIAEQIVELPQLEKDIGRCLTPAGEILDSASVKLADLRYQLVEVRQQLLDRLEAMLRSRRIQKLIQEPFVTEREGRYVIPVKIERQREIRGIVHDISNTGATVFLEPWATVELGNELRQLVVEERREVERILASLSAEVGANEAAIAQDVVLLSELDLALAKARYAEQVKAIEPQIIPDGGDGGDGSPRPWVLKLVNARHPLLKGRVVPLTVEIGRDFSGLIITGPNTGGKTVALKTVGLLTLMAQSGMPLPASEETCLPVFDGIFTDIGDEQSIEQTLSTFSWHMGNIVRIIRSSTEKSLVLLDELGTSTDPNEGTALARAILLHFLSRKTLTVATTHYGELKVFGHNTPGLQNASLDFDPATLMPTYHLTVGVPGGSNALAIASQLGLSPEIVAAARGMLGRGAQEMEALLQDLMNERQRLQALRLELEREKGEAEKLRSHWESEMQGLEEQERNMLREARDRVSAAAAELQREIRQAASELRKEKSRARIEQAKRTLDATHEQLQAPEWETRASEETAGVVEVAAGDRVWLREAGVWGTVLSVPDGDGQLEVQVGQTRLRLGLDQIEKVMKGAAEETAEPTVLKREPGVRRRSLELDLRGKRADEVAPELDAYLNDASLAHLSRVRIIHGFGTGTVRQIVRDMLARHPLVKSFQPGGKGEGGDGVTMVEL